MCPSSCSSGAPASDHPQKKYMFMIKKTILVLISICRDY